VAAPTRQYCANLRDIGGQSDLRNYQRVATQIENRCCIDFRGDFLCGLVRRFVLRGIINSKNDSVKDSNFGQMIGLASK
jgi:hypothetical protein